MLGGLKYSNSRKERESLGANSIGTGLPRINSESSLFKFSSLPRESESQPPMGEIENIENVENWLEDFREWLKSGYSKNLGF